MPRLWVWLSNQELVLRLVSLLNQQTNCGRKKMYLGAKKVSIFSKNPLTNRILPVQSFTEHRTQNTEHRTQNTEHRTQNTEHRTQNTEHGIQHNSIYRANTLSHASEAAGGISVCGLAAFKSFFPSHHPGSLLGKK